MGRTRHYDFDYSQITVRDSKANKDRVTMPPDRLEEPLRRHLEKVRKLHEQDLRDGYREVSLPCALARKHPNAGKELA